MALPKLTVDQVKNLIPQASDIQELDKGGQKLVFTGTISGKEYALKFMDPNLQLSAGPTSDDIDNVTARARREVETMQQCSSPHLVKVGPIGLQSGEVDEKQIIFFSEEFVAGKDLKRYLEEQGVLPVDELIHLGMQISQAIETIWQYRKIHRDIKPGNIMRRDVTHEFILLDMGLVFDLQDESLSNSPVGTLVYFSPEQMDFKNRRTVMNFRSDLFSLGIVMYQMATGQHPFVTSTSIGPMDVFENIVNMVPEPPDSLRPELPDKLSDIIMRLLAKSPALRYRTVLLFQSALREVEERGA